MPAWRCLPTPSSQPLLPLLVLPVSCLVRLGLKATAAHISRKYCLYWRVLASQHLGMEPFTYEAIGWAHTWGLGLGTTSNRATSRKLCFCDSLCFSPCGARTGEALWSPCLNGRNFNPGSSSWVFQILWSAQRRHLLESSPCAWLMAWKREEPGRERRGVAV